MCKNCLTGYVSTPKQRSYDNVIAAGERLWNRPTYILKFWYKEWTDCLVKKKCFLTIYMNNKSFILLYLKDSNRKKSINLIGRNLRQ